MPYRIIKKVKRAVERPFIRSSDYAMNFGVDLDDEKTWKLYPLHSTPSPRLRGEVSQLLNANGEKLHTVNESFDFEIYCSRQYVSGLKIVEKRFLYLPEDLVRGYGIDDDMVIDLLLHEVIRVQWGKKIQDPLYPKIVKTGPIDIKPKDDEGKETIISEPAKPKPEIMDVADFKSKIAKIQSLMVRVSTGQVYMTKKSQEYEELYHQLEKYFGEFNLRNPNPFSTLEEFYGFYRMKFPTYQQRRDYINNLYKDAEAFVSSPKPKTLRKEESTMDKKEHDVLICHASEDKEAFVRELAEALSKENLKVWYDEFSLSLGDSLMRKIDYGISNSRYGVGVLSESFFKKDWPQKELGGLVAKERNFDKVILPIWHGVTREQVESFSPILADRVAASSDKGIDHVVKEILKAIK